jgi:hypothetical protein
MHIYLGQYDVVYIILVIQDPTIDAYSFAL